MLFYEYTYRQKFKYSHWFLAKRDLTALTPDKLQAKYKINQADLLILFGGSIPEGADVFAKAYQQNIAKNYLLVGGAGHTTEALRQKCNHL